MILHPFICPHCLRESLFQLRGSYRIAKDIDYFATFWSCRYCQKPISVLLATRGFDPESFISDSISVPHPLFFRNETSDIQVFPDPAKPSAPKHTPEPIAKAYRQGIGSLKRGEFEPCLMLMRKVLDLTIKKINPEATGTLAARIRKTADARRITDEMADWANEIKDLGNDATHDPVDVPEADAAEITKFTELFLMYIFTLPGMLAARRPTAPRADP